MIGELGDPLDRPGPRSTRSIKVMNLVSLLHVLDLRNDDVRYVIAELMLIAPCSKRKTGAFACDTPAEGASADGG